MQKTAVSFAKSCSDGALLVCRDTAHRSGVSDSTHNTRDSRNTLVKDSQEYSDQVQTRFEAAQQRFLVEKGPRGARLLRHRGVSETILGLAQPPAPVKAMVATRPNYPPPAVYRGRDGEPLRPVLSAGGEGVAPVGREFRRDLTPEQR